LIRFNVKRTKRTMAAFGPGHTRTDKMAIRHGVCARVIDDGVIERESAKQNFSSTAFWRDYLCEEYEQ
jgi:hypothetical protein